MKSVNVENLKDKRWKQIDDYIDWIDIHDLYDCGAIVAGGALRSLLVGDEEVKDLDLFFYNQESVDKTRTFLESSGYALVFKCPLGHLYTYAMFDENKDENGKSKILTKIQLITRSFYTSLEHIVSTFDLMPCCVATDGKRLVFADKWVRSVKKKMLYLNALTYPVATLNRIDKYKQKGYYASEGFYVDIITEIQSKSFDGEQLALYID